MDKVAWCTTFHLEIKAFPSVLEKKLCSSFTVSGDEWMDGINNIKGGKKLIIFCLLQAHPFLFSVYLLTFQTLSDC